MTTKDWQSEVEAAAEKYAEDTDRLFEFAVKWAEVRVIFTDGASWAREKLAEYDAIPKVPQTEAVREENKRVIELENKIAILESRASQFESTIKATLAREERLVEALEFYAGQGDGTWENHVCDSYSGSTVTFDWPGEMQDEPYEIARAALKAWRGEG